MLGVLLLLRGGPRLIWDLVALDDALAGGHAADGPKRPNQWVRKFYVCGPHEPYHSAARSCWHQRQSRPGGVSLDVEVGGVERLPDAVQIRLAVGRARRLKGLARTGPACDGVLEEPHAAGGENGDNNDNARDA
jgi:hypothetical protein